MAKRYPNDEIYTSTGTKYEEARIVGECYGDSKKKKVSKYKELGLEVYLSRESRKSSGDYVLVDDRHEKVVIIGSSGFSGGYIYDAEGDIIIGRSLHCVLNEVEKSSISVCVDHLNIFLDNKYGEKPPFTTCFENVTRIPPSCLLVINDSVVQTRRLWTKSEKKGSTFEGVLEKTLSPLTSVNRQIVIMYSGGIDSTSLYLAVKKVVGEYGIKAVTVDIPQSSNSKENAVCIGKKYDINTEILDYSWPPESQDVKELILSEMKYDIVNQNNPHWRVLTRYGDSIILSGQNMDTILTNGMHRPDASAIKYPLRYESLKIYLNKLKKNILYTDTYIENRQLAYLYYLASLFVFPDKYNFDIGINGAEKGLISTGVTSVYKKAYSSVIGENLKIYRQYKSSEKTNIGMMRYIQHQHNAASTIAKLARDGSSVHLPAMWQPLNSYGISKVKGLKEAIFPKQELYNYINSITDKSYVENSSKCANVYQRSEVASSRDPSSWARSELVNSLKHMLRPSESRLFDVVSDKQRYLNLIGSVNIKSDKNTLRNIEKCFKLINLEMIIRKSL